MRKFENCDLLAVLGEIASHNTKNFLSDFLIDEEILSEAAQEKNGLDRRYLWMSRSCGTHCLKEKDVFLQGTSEHNTWTAYSDKAKEIIAFAVDVIGFEDGVLKGDLYELDYASHCAMVKNEAVPIGHIRLFCKDGDIYIPYSDDWRNPAKQYSYDERKFIPVNVMQYNALLARQQADRLDGGYNVWNEKKLKLEYGDMPTFGIYQLKEEAEEGLFLSYFSAVKSGLKVDKRNYELTYIGENYSNYSLDELYEVFNVRHPLDFCGHSLSVSDVITYKHSDGSTEAYYVDSCGFVELPDFFGPPQKIPAQM